MDPTNFKTPLCSRGTGMCGKFSIKVATLIMAALVVGCTPGEPREGASRVPGTARTTHRVEAGSDAPSRIQEALIVARPGDVVELGPGTFAFESTLSLDVPRVTLRGQGPEATILSFKGQGAGTGGEGVLITSDRAIVEDLAIEDTRGDALKINGAQGIVVRRVRAEWTGDSKEANGAYGIYPVQCSQVLVEHCTAKAASDAGIYVGQSQDVVVRHNRATGNVAGIEIENCTRADVYENVATGNTGGILVFSLPNLPADCGSQCRVFRNQVMANNHPNFAPPGSIVGTVPPGTGMMVMAYDHVEIFENTIADNQTANLAIISYLTTGKKFEDPKYDPYPEAIDVHDNTFQGGGDRPAGKWGAILGVLVGGRFPDIIYDGIVNDAKLVDGRLPPELRIYIRDNGDADFANFDLANLDPLKGKLPQISRELAAHQGRLAALKSVTLEELE